MAEPGEPSEPGEPNTPLRNAEPQLDFQSPHQQGNEDTEPRNKCPVLLLMLLLLPLFIQILAMIITFILSNQNPIAAGICSVMFLLSAISTAIIICNVLTYGYF
ncbi:protein A8 [Aotine betaherpesvirus 1]|uniref:Protein A8 n=1 Tax=Aotine betaherpesvirus 1 TaxID=50290 RepID=G8XU81_9BETA|nr:protein A8 [Aotine betaherpesvirus 1]AEV80818.1 protein A8 [Aotine betaherpesvirus 1]